MKDKTLYTEDSIKSLDPRSFCRLRPATYLGSNEYSTQLAREIISNSIDEHIIGNCFNISVIIDKKQNKYTVIDDGQGFPINVKRKEDDKTILEAAMSVLNTSGKYDEDGIYKSVSGLNGIGSKLTNYLSLLFEVVSYNSNGDFEHLIFKDGLFQSRDCGTDKTHKSGTEISWIPDTQFFQNPEANITDLKKLFTDISALCPKLTIRFIVDNEEIVYKSENGIQDLLNNKLAAKEILTNRFVVRKELTDSLVDMCMTYTSDYSNNITAYVNYSLTESGIHISTVRAGLTRQINKYAFDNNLLKKAQDPLTQAELDEGLILVFNVRTDGVKFDSQTKVRIVDINKTIINSVINNEFVDWLNNNPKDVKIIIDKALTARKAKEAAQKAKDGIRNAGVKNKKFISLPTKLTDCFTKHREEAEIFIVEGNSAAGGLIAKRDGKTQAIFPVRGKVLSCRKAATEKIYANQEISNIVKALGLDINKDTGKLVYDNKKLRYGKIIFAADSDDDGKAIVSLLINMFWWLCQDLILNGHVYIAYPPLFRITTNKNEYIYLKDEAALTEYKNKHKKEAFIISRNKGLGESSNDELKYCLLDPTTRNVKQLVVNDIKAADDLLECFFGNNVEIRRQYLLDGLADFINSNK